jgi:hypothetical protein
VAYFDPEVLPLLEYLVADPSEQLGLLDFVFFTILFFASLIASLHFVASGSCD